MIEYIEAKPLPLVCQKCEEQQEDFNCDCGSCEHAGERWYLSRKDELTLQRKAAEKSIERLQSKIAAIDKELDSLK